MNKEELIQARELIKEQFKNLSDSNWIALELSRLQGKFDILEQVIKDIEKEEQNAADSTAKQANSNNNKRK